MRFFIPFISALATLASAYTPPDYSKSPSGNAIILPGQGNQVAVGTPYTITWEPSTPGKVSLVLLRGPSTNLVHIDTLADGISNSGKFVWTPSTSLRPDVTHYALMLVVEGTGQYQYSTQFGVSNPSFTPTSTSSSDSSTTTAAPDTAASGTATTSAPTTTSDMASDHTSAGTTTTASTASTTENSGTTTTSAPSTTFTTKASTSSTGTSTATSTALIPSKSASITVSPSSSHGSANLGASSSASPTPTGLLPLPNAAGRSSVSVGGIAAAAVAAVVLF